MALQMETIRAAADRVAASHQLEIVDLEFTGGAKHRCLRVFLEKDAASRAQMAAQIQAQRETELASSPAVHPSPSKRAAQPALRVPVETLSGVSHDDCANFARDFGTLLDVEDLVPGAEYTLEVSSPGLERKLLKPADYQRFQGSLAKIQTFTPIQSNRHFTGRLVAFDGAVITLDLSAVKQRSKPNKPPTTATIEIPLTNVEKANLIAEI
ncbi:MAG: ribosome maturation factor RimP [Acidobacteriaceae bacterium]